MRSYSQLRTYETFDERFEYLTVGGRVGEDTFGASRWMNQRFYSSIEWQQARNRTVARDLGLDLGIVGREILTRVYVHHMNPMKPEDIQHFNPAILDPEYLISVSLETHNAIHYGNRPPKPTKFVERRPGDTTLW